MSITKTGTVRISADKLEAGGFDFDCSDNLSGIDCSNEVIDWAIARLESERIDTKESQ